MVCFGLEANSIFLMDAFVFETVHIINRVKKFGLIQREGKSCFDIISINAFFFMPAKHFGTFIERFLLEAPRRLRCRRFLGSKVYNIFSICFVFQSIVRQSFAVLRGIELRIINSKICQCLSPSLPPWSIIFSPPSLRQVMLGAGDPVAAHFKVTLLPSRTTMSVLVG